MHHRHFSVSIHLCSKVLYPETQSFPVVSLLRPHNQFHTKDFPSVGTFVLPALLQTAYCSPHIHCKIHLHCVQSDPEESAFAQKTRLSEVHEIASYRDRKSVV